MPAAVCPGSATTGGYLPAGQIKAPSCNRYEQASYCSGLQATATCTVGFGTCQFTGLACTNKLVKGPGQNPSGLGAWLGMSCPTGYKAVWGKVTGVGAQCATSSTSLTPAQGLAVPGQAVCGRNYPVFPHYTFPSGETGYVVSASAQASGAYIDVDCEAL
jgi:hypothetical protein